MKKGFTLVETLVAISILMVSVVGPMVFVANGIKASYYARDQITAFYLAQDAVEALRFLRDNDRIAIVKNGLDPANPANWPTFNTLLGGSTGSIANCVAPAVCGIDTVKIYNGDLSSQSIGGTATFLGVLSKTDTGYYGYTGTPTKFKRNFSYTKNGDEIELTVTVTWDSGQILGRTFQTHESLLYWY